MLMTFGSVVRVETLRHLTKVTALQRKASRNKVLVAKHMISLQLLRTAGGNQAKLDARKWMWILLKRGGKLVVQQAVCLAQKTSRNETRLHTQAKSNFPPGGGCGIYIGLYNQFVNSIQIRAFRTNSILSIRLIWNAKKFNSIRASSEDLKDLLAPLMSISTLHSALD